MDNVLGLADIHMRMIFSYDDTTCVPAVLERANQVGLDIIAITVHDEIRGGLHGAGLCTGSTRSRAAPPESEKIIMSKLNQPGHPDSGRLGLEITVVEQQ